MNTVILEKYNSFQCLAGECPSTCCAGWRIAVDKKDVMRFEGLEPEWLRRDILSNLLQEGERYFFKNRMDGRCAMLDEDGLCRIQRNTSEETLCNTCRKYPRLIRGDEEVLYLSMAASCPVLSKYLLQEEVYWMISDDLGERKRVQTQELQFVKAAWALYQQNFAAAAELPQGAGHYGVLYTCFEKMAEGILDILLSYQERSFSAKYLEALETDCSDYLENFIKGCAAVWKKLVPNYMCYRISGRRIEFPEEADDVCIRQAQGELFLLRTFAFCRYVKQGGLSEEDFADLLQRVYRFCVHGKKSAEAFAGLLDDFFTQDILWSYVLL